MKGLFLNRIILLLGGLCFFQACNNQLNTTVANFQSKAVEYPKNSVIPQPDHIVILVLENHEYSQIIGSKDAPYINSLAKDTFSTNFIRFYNVDHPSQPNYLNLYSGFNQGVTDDGYPVKVPFTTANLGRQLMDAGKSFVTYSEDLPAIGYNGEIYGAYVRKHNPAANWMGPGKNQIPANTNQPFTAFPSDYAKLPTVSLVVPNQINDMHSGSVRTGDAWVRNHLDGFV